MSRIEITKNISISENELGEAFVRSPGPGGQNVNKVATAVQLRFDVRHSPSLPEDVRERLEKLSGSRLTESGELIIEAHRFRSREQNRRDARERLISLIQRAAIPPRKRKKTGPTKKAKARRLEEKKRQSEKKKQRRIPGLPDD